MPKLFEGTETTTFADADRVATAISAETGARWIRWANFKTFLYSFFSRKFMYKSGFWNGSLNNVVDNVLELDRNAGQRMFINAEDGTIFEIQIYVDDLGSGGNTNYVNVTKNSLDLFSSNQTLSVGLNTFTSLQNDTYIKGDELKLEVITGTGNDDVSFGYLSARVEVT